MVTKDIQTLNLKFDQVIFSSLVLTWKRHFEVTFVTMATHLPSFCFIQFLEQLLKFLANFNLLKYVKSQISYGFLITKELIFGFQIWDLKDHFSASLMTNMFFVCYLLLKEADIHISPYQFGLF